MNDENPEPTQPEAGEVMHTDVVVNPAHPVDEDPEQLAGDVVPDPWSTEGSWAEKEETP